jgi:putative transcriptional regulator
VSTRRKGTFGERLISSAREAVAIKRGELEPGRVTRYTADLTAIDPPPVYDAEQIKSIRSTMELSQPVFAAALNVSPETIRAWEQGKRQPDGPTLRLLEVAQQHPDLFLRKIRRRSRSVARRTAR